MAAETAVHQREAVEAEPRRMMRRTLIRVSITSATPNASLVVVVR